MSVPTAIYARQSNTRDGSASLETQLEVCRAAADRLGLAVLHELVEPPSTSGFTDRGRLRPQWGRLLKMVKAGEVRAVLAHKTDRLSRGGGPGWAPLIDAFEKAKVDLDRCIATTDGWVGELELAVRAAMDREESKKLSERTRLHQDRRRARGLTTGGGTRGFGYTTGMEIVPVEADMLRDAAHRTLAGESIYSITKRWNETGIATPTGRKWTTESVAQTLKRPALFGMLVHKGEIVGPGTWEPILDEVTGRRLHRTLTDPARSAIPGVGWHPRALFLSGILRCGRCLRPLRGQRAQGDRPASYWCYRRVGSDACGALRVVAPPVDAHVTAKVLKVLDAQMVGRATAGRAADVDTAALLAELRGFDAERERVADARADGAISHAGWLAAERALQRRIDGVSARLACVEHDDRLRVLAGPGTLAERWEALGEDQQRALITAATTSITVAPVGKRGPGFDPARLHIAWAS